ncbi:MAG: N-acetylmuramoyl-L-alanine amidase [Proteobacteria bacterium]|nr:N-acetylmuramoyl-L-alanine amidase [Pseudomonadota bacterium]
MSTVAGLKKRPRTDYLVVHASATRPSQDIGARTIDRWHRGRGWACIGYHFVIRRDGTVEEGRGQDLIGAHVYGHNATSLGICLAGGVAEKDGKTAENNYTPEQMVTLVALLKDLSKQYRGAVIQGHRDFKGVKKDCPCFDVRKWWKEVNT